MKRYSERYKSTVVSELNVTPLIDLAFTLLIIFMITTPLIEQSIDISLPEEDAKQSTSSPQQQETLVISIAPSGTLYLDKRLISLKELEIALKAQHQRNPDTAIAIRSDAKAFTQELVNVLNVSRGVGFKKMDIKTSPRHNP